MERLVKVTRFALPLLLAVIPAAVKISAGQLELAPLVLVMLGGALLGWAAALALESVAILTRGMQRPQVVSDRALAQLERDKDMMLRSIKDLELDTALGKIEPAEAQLLAEPLRVRALTLLRELDEAQATTADSVEAQIEAELARRLGTGGAASAPPSAKPPGDAASAPPSAKPPGGAASAPPSAKPPGGAASGDPAPGAAP